MGRLPRPCRRPGGGADPCPDRGRQTIRPPPDRCRPCSEGLAAARGRDTPLADRGGPGRGERGAGAVRAVFSGSARRQSRTRSSTSAKPDHGPGHRAGAADRRGRGRVAAAEGGATWVTPRPSDAAERERWGGSSTGPTGALCIRVTSAGRRPRSRSGPPVAATSAEPASASRGSGREATGARKHRSP